MHDSRTEFFLSGAVDNVSNVIPGSAVAAVEVETVDVSHEPAGQADDAGRAFAKRVIAFAQTVPGYDEVIEAADVPIPQHVVDYIKTSPIGPALGYFLAKNLKTCRCITWMPRDRATRLLRRLESKLQVPRLALVHNVDAPAGQVRQSDEP